jgi:outer membrane protein assembly factor BamB
MLFIGSKAMGRRLAAGAAVAVVAASMILWPARAEGQFAPATSTGFDLSETVQLDRADSAVLASLERVKAYLAAQQWDEAVETLRQLSQNAAEKLVGVTPQRFVALRDYCQLQLAALPAEALRLYRSRVDTAAQSWYEEGLARRNPRLVAKVVEQAFASSWGDKALWVLGEMALESGDYTAARWYWERILPYRPPPDALWAWPAYPDSRIDPAAVRARLVLVSILEGARQRAEAELSQLRRLHPESRGRLGGIEVNYCEALGALLAESAAWHSPVGDGDWPTFAGSPTREKRVPFSVDPAGVAWRVPLRRMAASSDSPFPPHEDRNALLSYFPVAAGNLVLINHQGEILAVQAATGAAAWGAGGAAVYRDQFEGAAGVLGNPPGTVGVPRFTMTIHENHLYARLGPMITSRPQELPPTVGNGYLVCLDLAAQGLLRWKVVPEEGWAFEGSPLADGAQVYVGMRRDDVRPQAYVACLDARNGQLRWRRFICGAETPARTTRHQATHNLLTLHRGLLYYNTNLGGVAALDAEDGHLRWLTLYPRALQGDLRRLATHWFRDPSPGVFHGGVLYVAPSDSPRIFAIDAGNGQILWQSGEELEDVLHLLGVVDDCLIASGRRLYWIRTSGERQGRVNHAWPDGQEQLGYGRGLLLAEGIYWPTRDKIYVFDPRAATPRRVIELKPRGLTGGNLLVAGGRLLVATGSELVALSNQAGAGQASPELVRDQTQATPHPSSLSLPQNRP